MKRTWLLGMLIQGVEALPEHPHVPPATDHGHIMMRRLEVDADGIASLVKKKANTPWMPEPVR